MNELFPEQELKFDIVDNKNYKIKVIKDSIVYAKKAKKHLSD